MAESGEMQTIPPGGGSGSSGGGDMTIAKLGASVVVCYLLIMLTQYMMKSSDRTADTIREISKENNDAHRESIKEFKDSLKEQATNTREWMKVQGDRNAAEVEKTRQQNADLHERQIKLMTDNGTTLREIKAAIEAKKQ